MAVFISLSNFHTHLIFLLYRNFKDILRVFYMNVNYQQKNNIACRSLFYILTTRGSQEKIVSIIIVVVPLSFFFDFFLLISQCILLLLTSKLRIAPLTHHIDLHIFFFFGSDLYISVLIRGVPPWVFGPNVPNNVSLHRFVDLPAWMHTAAT